MFVNSPHSDPVTEQVRFIPAVPDGWSFILDYPRPPRGLSANDRPNRWVKAGAVKDVRFEVMVKTRALKLGVLEKIRVDVEWFVGTRHRRDTDNLAPFLKAIYDGIASSSTGYSAHLVDDDDPEHMEKPSAVIRYQRGIRPHFCVTITAVTE